MFNREEFFKTDRPSLIILVLFSLAMFFLNLGGRDLWAPDEGEYAQISQEMIETGEWIIPRLNGVPSAQKPPLFNWAAAVFSLPVGRVTELTARLPSATMGLVGVLATYWLGRGLFGRRAGLLSALILATSPIYLHQARWVQVDMVYSTLVTLTLVCFYYGYLNNANRGRYFLPGTLFMSLGILTKGPAAIVLPGLTILIFLAFKKRLREFLTRDLLLYLVVCVAIISPWYLSVYLKAGTDFAWELIVKHNFYMFFDTWSHKRPFYYYFINIPWEFFPWIVFLPAAILNLLANDKEREQRLFLFVWFVGMFCFFSLSQAKQGKYILPLFPAIALIVGRFWDDILSERQSLSYTKCLLIPATFLATVMVFGSAAGAWIVNNKHPEFLKVTLPLGSLLALSGAALFIMALFRLKRELFTTIVVSLLLIATYLAIFINPEINHYKTARPFCEETARIAKDRELGIYGIFLHQVGPYVFYTGRKLKTFDDEKAVIRFFSTQERAFCIMRDTYFKSFKDKYDGPVYSLLYASVGHRNVHLVSNKR
ncbi:MAG: glycosyltransferase family 39 protein [Candidatus Brocadiales bacterium]